MVRSWWLVVRSFFSRKTSEHSLKTTNYQLSTISGVKYLITAVVFISIILIFIVLERSRINPKQIAIISALSAVSALGRIPFAGIPNVQPTTFIVIISGYVLGIRAGFMVGATTVIVSNFFMGHGPWTVWQMLAWGTAGVSAGLLKWVFGNINKLQLTVFCALWGYFFGWLMNLWTWVEYIYPHDLSSYLGVCATSFMFDTLHAIGNTILAWMLGKEFISIISRFKQKTEITYL